MLEQQEILDTAAQPSILQASACHLSELDVIWKHWAQREMKARYADGYYDGYVAKHVLFR